MSDQDQRRYDDVLCRISDKLDNLRRELAELATGVALNNQSYRNLNGELQEHKKNDKWRANRNIAIVAIMFTALGCWVGLKGLDTGPVIPAIPTTKEITPNDRGIKNH